MSEYPWQLRGHCYLLGDNVPHPGGVIPLSLITARETDPAVLIPHLFSETDPGFAERVRPGDLIVTGKNFGMGPKGCGYIAMQALGLGLLCESMSVQAYREAISTGLAVLNPCPQITTMCAMHDDLEVNFQNGLFINHTKNIRLEFPAIPKELQELVSKGGNTAWLKFWQESQKK